MKTFDFNIHLPLLDKGEVNTVVADEFGQDVDGLLKAINQYSDDISALNGGHFMLFNTRLFETDPDNFSRFEDAASSLLHDVSFSALVDFRMDDVRTYVERAFDMGADGIKFHAYHQQISDDYHNAILSICHMAEERNRMICIDTSYGTSKMYQHDNLKLACHIADHITKVPIVLLHIGGARVLEAMLLAHEKQNVFLESSFSLGYYEGSSIWQDAAFAFRKIGIERVMYGSDYPYVSMEESLRVHHDFYQQFRFTETEIEHMMYHNARNMLRTLG